ncbi:efflux RND transporter periplasmic adaptor subunit [Thalassotalea sp. HSM 43]|uniref:efflux RND transporter periplasmic adaptor subunit n=1 Tax=Thalassotalea sp. HSM 43 TaxID=2552945 RepID=UPI00107FD937|nr:efflux RND transporter periplasmic adaptor subunit [Thalassotalea sp. HSM 43]QBY04720.1 efflux RND transporter periplasmic adaptor subunit [Thalassotalea sp. HSM 43]
MFSSVSVAIKSLLILWLLFSFGCKDSQQGPGTTPPPSVTVIEVGKSNVKRSVTYNGRVEAVDAVELTARVQGFLLERLKSEGAQVEAGELLFVIEKDSYIAEVERVKGALEKLRGARRLAQIERDRRAKLVKTKAISQEQLDIAEANLIEVNGEITSQKAALRTAELNLSYTDVKAPISGKIGLSPYSVGDFVGPSSKALSTVVSQDPSYVTFPITQRELMTHSSAKTGITPEQIEVRVKMADGSYYQRIGKLDFIDVVADPTTDTLLVRAKFDNPDGVLVHQQLVNVELQEQNPRTEITVPQSAVQFDQQGRYVLLVDDENKVVVQRIEAGATIQGKVVIKNGLQEGQKVITLGVQKVRPGVVVNPNIASAE